MLKDQDFSDPRDDCECLVCQSDLALIVPCLNEDDDLS